ncbi:aminotransferase class V-fold PLP-dependent enzyme [Actinomycetota bacterium]
MTMPSLPRSQFPVTDVYAYFDTASVGPTPLSSIDAVSASLRSFAAVGSGALPDHLACVQQTRAQVGELLGARAASLSFVTSTTAGLGAVANGRSWRRIAVAGGQFPAMSLPFASVATAEVTWVDGRTPGSPSLEEYRAALRTARPPELVVAPWVDSHYHVLDVTALAQECHAVGAALCVDLTRGAGVIPVNLVDSGVDFAVTNSYKWLMAPPGAAVLYRSAQAPTLTPLSHNWMNAVLQDGEILDAGGAATFEQGTPQILNIVALQATSQLLLEAAPVWPYVSALLEELGHECTDRGLTPLRHSPDGQSHGPALVIPTPDAALLRRHCAERRVLVGGSDSHVVISVHAFNDHADLATLLSALTLNKTRN